MIHGAYDMPDVESIFSRKRTQTSKMMTQQYGCTSDKKKTDSCFHITYEFQVDEKEYTNGKNNSIQV